MTDRTTAISGVEQITAGWLTQVLTESGALIEGEVSAFDVEKGSGNWSENVRMRVHYAAGSQGERPLYLIDRQPFDWSLTTWLGVFDLAYAVFSDWEVDFRRAHERAILEHYLAELRRRGIAGYGWEQLWDDYRLSLAMGVYVAVEYCRGGINERSRQYWSQMLWRTLTACDDLNCYELWKRVGAD